MSKIPFLAAIAATISFVPAQSSTLPKGFDQVPGNSFFWAGFSVAPSSTSTTKYYVSREAFLYDASTFPWDPKKPKVIDKISFRRSATSPSANATAHNAKWVVIMSTSNQPVHRPNTKIGDNHGANRKVVYGSMNNPKTVAFLATPKPGTGKTAPFDVTLDITNFIVPPNSKTLVIEIRSYSSDVKSGIWYVDSVLHSGTNFNGGRYSLFYSTHCINPKAFFSSRANYLNGHYGHIWRTFRKAGLPVIGFAGTRLAAGVKVPNTAGCLWHINPILTAVTLTENGPSNTSNPGQGAAYLNWGSIPNLASLVGVKLAHQAIIIDPAANALGIGITRAGEGSIGTGYDPKLVKVSGPYSYGASNSRSVRLMDPNKEIYGRFFFRRAPIIKIQ